MRPSDLRYLWEYSYERTGQILDQAENLSDEQYSGSPPFGDKSVRDILVHQLSTERGWRHAWQTGERVEGLEPADFPDVGSLRDRWQVDQKEMFAYLDGLTGRDLDGTFSDAPLWPLIVHVWNHGTQHRSEVAMLLTHFGHSPGDLDLAFFVFERAEA